jgi:hypothetical protein
LGGKELKYTFNLSNTSRFRIVAIFVTLNL